MAHNKHREVSPKTANDWLIILREYPDDQELRASFNAWWDSSPAHQKDWDKATHLWSLLGATQPAHRQKWSGFQPAPNPIPSSNIKPIPTMQGIERIPGTASTASVIPVAAAKAEVHRKSGKPKRRFAFATLAAAACLAVIVGPRSFTMISSDHSTGLAETQTLSLSDGSQVTLAPNTSIDVAYSRDTRRVVLRDGKAFFTVQSNKDRPFVVSTSDLDTQVLGTAFEVLQDNDRSEVKVREGRVQVANRHLEDSPAQKLTAGETLDIDQWGASKKGKFPAELVAAWSSGKLIAHQQTVGDVVSEIGQFYSGVVLVRGERLSQQPITGYYDLTQPLSALRAIAQTQNAEIQQLSPWVVILSEK